MRQRRHESLQIRIRRCSLRDVPAVLALWKHAAAAPSVTDDRAAVRRRLQRDRDLFLLAWDGSTLVGTLIGGWDGWRANLARLAVHPAYRRHGIAHALLERVEGTLRRRGAKRISGIVLRHNRGGRAFWSAAAYRLDPEVVRYVKDLS